MEALLYIAAFAGNVFAADPQAVVTLLTELSRLNARLVSLDKLSRHRSVGSGLSAEEARVFAEAQSHVAQFHISTGINVVLHHNGRGSVPATDSRLRIEFVNVSHEALKPFYIESLDSQLAAAEEENWELVNNMLGYRVGLNLISEHTEPFDSLSEDNIQYIEGKIQDGNVEGEFFESLSIDESDLRGYWKILN